MRRFLVMPENTLIILLVLTVLMLDGLAVLVLAK
jgi:hypothetical protein